MVRYLACVAAALLLGTPLWASELDREFVGKQPPASVVASRANNPTDGSVSVPASATNSVKATELDGEMPTQAWRGGHGCGFRGGWGGCYRGGCGWGGGYRGCGYGWGCGYRGCGFRGVSVGWGGCGYGGCGYGGCGYGGCGYGGCGYSCYAYYPSYCYVGCGW